MPWVETFRVERGASSRRAFTLIELIIVMTILGVVMASAAPSLTRFFRGRKLDSEVRRFISLTRYARSLAAERAIPMIVWLDANGGTYGLRPESGNLLRNVEEDSQRMALAVGYGFFYQQRADFRLSETLRLVVDPLGPGNSQIVTIRFLPDGTIDPISAKVLQIVQDDPSGQAQTEVIWIALSRNSTRYEVVDATTARDRSETQMRMDSGLYVR